MEEDFEDTKYTYNLKDGYIEYPFITAHNNYFGSINKKPKDIKTFYDIIIQFNKYLFEINYLSNSSYLMNLLSEYQTSQSINPLEQMKNNITEFSNYYNSLYEIEELKTTDEFIRYTYMYVELIWRSLFIFYQYYYIDNIKSSIFTKKPKSLLRSKSLLKSKSFKIDEKITKYNLNKILEFYNKITKEYNDNNYPFIEDYKNKLYGIIYKYNQLNFDDKINDAETMFIIIYKLILINYNNLLFNYNSNKYLSPHKAIDKSIDILKGKKLNNDYLSFIQNLLIDNYKKYKIVSASLLKLTTNKYITIPQYSGICWFISFLTGLTYSDKNRKLVISKKSSNLSNIKDLSTIDFKTDNNETIFTSFVYYIIEKISDISKTYSENLSEDCDIFKYLKKIPELFLTKLVDDKFKEKDFSQIEIRKIRDKDKEIDKAIKKYYTTEIEKDFAEPNNYIYNVIINKKTDTTYLGALKSQYIIIKKFYEYLNIDCLFVYDISNNKYVKNDQFDREKEYDIIVISKNSVIAEFIINNIHEITKISDDLVMDKTLKSFTYNGIEYELDYVMQSTDSDKSCEECGHNVCSLNYNNKEYYYNSTYSVQDLKCDDNEDIRLPCSFIEHEWSKHLTKDEYCFSLLKCNYIPNYEYYDEINNMVSSIIINNSSNTCYSNKTGQQFCYVRKTAIQGGKSKKIERKVYMDKKTNKYYVNYNNMKIYLTA